MDFDLNVAMGTDVRDDSHLTDSSCNSQSSKEQISHKDAETPKKVAKIPVQHDCTLKTPEKLDLYVAMGLHGGESEDDSCSTSSEEADSNGDKSTAKKVDQINRIPGRNNDRPRCDDLEANSQSTPEANFRDTKETFGNDRPRCDDLEANSQSTPESNSHATKETFGNDHPRCYDKKAYDNNRMPRGLDGPSISLLAQIEKRLQVGSDVIDLDKSYLLYCEYARLMGFSVRKNDQRYIGNSKEIRWKEYTCSCKGATDTKNSKDVVADFRKMEQRSNCMAKIRVGRDQLKWKVTKFDKNHNHPLVDVDQSYLLRSSRKISIGKLDLLEAMHSYGIAVHSACGFMEKMAGGIQYTGFIRKDVYNHFSKTKRLTRLEDGDSMALIEYLNDKSKSDPFLFWRVEKDDEGRLMNFFLRDSRCASDYKAFGDVLILDTTGGTNRYKLACAPFVGLNHHKANVMFGIGFLSDERTSSFNWLLEAFLESMDGIAPKVVYTDQCKALMNAVASSFPHATHRLCQWHIHRNAMSHFGSLASDSGFKSKWHRCMDTVETEDEFEEVWNDMMNSYPISNRDWFDTMYGLRQRWASVFTRNIFTAGLRATSRSECTNNVLKQYVKSTGSLYEFIRAYEEVLTRWRAEERAEDTRCMWVPGQFVNDSIFLNHAAAVYTRKIYKKIERQVAQSFTVFIDCENGVCLGEGNIQYMTKIVGSNATGRTLVFNHKSNCASCSCGMWEREGFVCSHILKMYSIKGIVGIPEPYILKRWTKRAKSVEFPEAFPEPTSSAVLSPVQFVHNMTKIFHDILRTESVDARRDIEETITALCRRVLTNDDGVLMTSSSKKKRKAVNGTDFRDPKNAKERRNASEPKKRVQRKGKQDGETQARKRAPKKRVVVDINLNATP